MKGTHNLQGLITLAAFQMAMALVVVVVGVVLVVVLGMRGGGGGGGGSNSDVQILQTMVITLRCQRRCQERVCKWRWR